MGIPKLCKNLSERYPSLCQKIGANELPQYDYVYIDINFLIHKAVSGRGGLPLEQVDDGFYSEARIFERILRYIETLHRIIPSKVLFLCMDGVAPRAKWSTQRQRRIRAANEQFDTNQISPGTVFIQRFENALQAFVSTNIKTQHNWQDCEVYVSGSSCAGEGSLKIINFIRSLKQSADYSPAKTHCIYSGDNDYLLLGIATHELYVSFVQECKKSKSMFASLCFDDTKHVFSVIHFELLRQYLRMEFAELQTQIQFDFNMDNIVDDWTVLMTLFGNDYVPGLPNFEMSADVLSVIYDAYKQVLKVSKGYINELGLLNIRRFARLLQTLKANEFDLFSKRAAHTGNMVRTMAALNVHDSGAKKAVSYNDFLDMKDEYYAEKLGDGNNLNFEQMSVSYVTSIQWTLFYYYRDQYPWNFHYPYKCAPFLCDFTAVHKMIFSLEISEPMKPLTHLLAILPTRSAHLLPGIYQPLVRDDIDDMSDLLLQSELLENCLTSKEKERNEPKQMRKYQYMNAASAADSVQVEEISPEKNRVHFEKILSRPLKKERFNFKFTTLNLLDFTYKLVANDLLKTYPRMIITLDNDRPDDLDVVANDLLNQTVLMQWPHYVEGKVLQVFNGEKRLDATTARIQATDNTSDFQSCVESLTLCYKECGLDVGDIKMVAYVLPLKWTEYKPIEGKKWLEQSKCWNRDKWLPVAVQTLIKDYHSDPTSIKSTREVLNKPTVFLVSPNAHYYGEIATINNSENVETTGRINVLCYKDSEPDFGLAQEVHVKAKKEQQNEFKQASSAAALLGISEKALACITGAILVADSEASEHYKKINIGLQLKSRNYFNASSFVLHHDYVKNIDKKFLYSQKAIDLVKTYMDKFARVFELLNASKAMEVRDFDENNNRNGYEYLTEVRGWLQSLSYFKQHKKPQDVLRLSDQAINVVRTAIQASNRENPKILKLKLKWTNVYIPDLNNVFVNPCAEATYKLLDRVIVARSGYPVLIGAKGTVIAIEPKMKHIGGEDVTDQDLYALEILMDIPFKIQSSICDFKEHQVFRTRSTSMLVNMSYGRIN